LKQTLLLISCFLIAASQSLAQTASPATPNPASGSMTPAADSPVNSTPGTARLMGIEDFSLDRAIQTGRANYLGVYLITLQDGQNPIKVLYRYALFQHDFTRELHAGADIPYRLDGKHVYLKSQDGKEVKTSLCEEKGAKLHCADMVFEPRKPKS
jgi:hypothetical protein